MSDFYGLDLEAYIMFCLCSIHRNLVNLEPSLPQIGQEILPIKTSQKEGKEIKCTIIAAIILLCEDNLFLLIPSTQNTSIDLLNIYVRSPRHLQQLKGQAFLVTQCHILVAQVVLMVWRQRNGEKRKAIQIPQLSAWQWIRDCVTTKNSLIQRKERVETRNSCWHMQQS